MIAEIVSYFAFALLGIVLVSLYGRAFRSLLYHFFVEHKRSYLVLWAVYPLWLSWCRYLWPVCLLLIGPPLLAYYLIEAWLRLIGPIADAGANWLIFFYRLARDGDYRYRTLLACKPPNEQSDPLNFDPLPPPIRCLIRRFTQAAR